MLRHSQLRYCAVSPASVLPKLIQSVRQSSSFLRSIPPELYVLYVPRSRTYHSTSVVDVGPVPLSRAVFYLRTYVSSDRIDVGALIGLGEPRTPDEGTAIFQKVRARASLDAPPPLQDGVAGSSSNNQRTEETAGSGSAAAPPPPPLHFIVLPELDPYAGNILPALLAAYPAAQVVCSSFVAATLTDKTFFSGMLSALGDAMKAGPESCTFASIDSSRIIEVSDNSVVDLNVASSDDGARRSLKFVQGDLSGREKRRGSLQLPLMKHDSMLVYDTSSKSVFAGNTCGVRYPWLRFTHDAANPSAVLPVPPPLTSTLGCQNRAHPSSLPWDVTESTFIAVSALRQLPLAQRVLATSYGEIAIDRIDMIDKLESAERAVQPILARAEEFAEKKTGDNNAMQLADAVKKKMLTTMLLSQTSSTPEPDESRSASVAFVESAVLNRASQCLVHAAMTNVAKRRPSSLPTDSFELPSVPSSASTRSKHRHQRLSVNSGVNGARTDDKTEMTTVQVEKLAEALELAKLPQEFGVKVRKERIDLDVFSAMTKEELQTVFKPLFGDLKRLQALQEITQQKRSASAMSKAYESDHVKE